MLPGVDDDVLVTSGDQSLGDRSQLYELRARADNAHDFHTLILCNDLLSSLTTGWGARLRPVADTMTGMRVLVVVPWFPSDLAPGSGIFNLRDVRLLAREHEVTVLHLVRPEFVSADESFISVADEGFGIERVPYGIASPATLLPAVRRVREMLNEADLVHSMAFSALPVMRLARPRIPWVHTEHYSQLIAPPRSRAEAIALGALKRLFRYPTETVAVSSSLAAVIDRYRRVPSTVVGNEVMMPVQRILEHRPEAIGSTPMRVRLLGVGGVVDRKGPMQAVEAMIEMRQRSIDASLTWVGEGDLAVKLRRRVAAAGVTDHLHLPGHLPPEKLSEELLDADVFLLPVETETFGVAIAEALAHGLPVVASGTGGHEEFLPPEASRVVDERSPGVLADAVLELLSDPELWTKLRISDYAASRFSPETRSVEYRGVYDRAIRGWMARRH
ncbi:hypothetical protein GCM10009847_01720 [Leucobacter tardus]